MSSSSQYSTRHRILLGASAVAIAIGGGLLWWSGTNQTASISDVPDPSDNQILFDGDTAWYDGMGMPIAQETQDKLDAAQHEESSYHLTYFMRNANPEYVNLDNVYLDSFVHPRQVARGVAAYSTQADTTKGFEVDPETFLTASHFELPIYDVDSQSNYYVAFPNLRMHDPTFDCYDLQVAYNNDQGELIEDYIYENNILYIDKQAVDMPANKTPLFDDSAVLAIQANYAYKDFQGGLENIDQCVLDIPISVLDTKTGTNTNAAIKATNMFDSYVMFDLSKYLSNYDDDKYGLSVMLNGMLMPISTDAFSIVDKHLIIYSTPTVISNINIVIEDGEEAFRETESQKTADDDKDVASSISKLISTEQAHAVPVATELNINWGFPDGDDKVRSFEEMKTFKFGTGADATELFLDVPDNGIYPGWRGNYDPKGLAHFTEGSPSGYLSNRPGFVNSIGYLYGPSLTGPSNGGDDNRSKRGTGIWAIQSYCMGVNVNTILGAKDGDYENYSNGDGRIIQPNWIYKARYYDEAEGTANKMRNITITYVDDETGATTTSSTGAPIYDWMMAFRNYLAKTPAVSESQPDYTLGGRCGGVQSFAFTFPTKIKASKTSLIPAGRPYSDVPQSNVTVKAENIPANYKDDNGNMWLAAICAHTSQSAGGSAEADTRQVYVACLAKESGYVVLAFTIPANAAGMQSAHAVYKFRTSSSYGVKIEKKAAIDLPGYSIANAKYGIYDSMEAAQNHSESNALKVLTTDASGKAQTGNNELLEGTYYLAEIQAPSKFKRSTKIYTFNLNDNTTTDQYLTISYDTIRADGAQADNAGVLNDQPLSWAPGVIVEKLDRDKPQSKDVPQARASLAGAQFTFKYYAGAASGNPTATWVLKTADNGKIDFQNNSLWVSGTPYKSDTGQNIVPIGTLVITETQAPEGYLIPNPVPTTTVVISANSAGDDVVLTVQNQTVNKNYKLTAEDIPKRGDIELVKHDDLLQASLPQGDADLEGIQFAIINRSTHEVQSPENPNELVAPGKEVCRIMTKKEIVDGKTVYRASTKTKDYNKTRNGSGTWNTPVANGNSVKENWHGSLAYGDYQVVELSSDGKYVSTGYLFGVWDGNTQKIWHGNAANGRWQDSWMNINNDAIVGNTFAYTTANGQKFDADSSNTHKWIDDDYAVVTFNDPKSGPNNSVQRGDIELIKSDDNWNDSRLQGDADLAGAVFEIYNASANVVVSPQTGEKVEPGGLVCTITSFFDTQLGKYRATTECPSGSAAATANGWSIPTSYAIVTGDDHGHALPYGQYVVVEKTPSLGYMLNSEWVGRAINNDNVHGEINFTVTNGNSFKLEGKTSNASATPTWIDAHGALVKFDNKKENEGKASQEHYHNGDAVPQAGESLDTTERVDESWIENTIFRAGIRIGKVDRQNGDYKPQGKATLETAVITVSSLCDNPIWTLKGTYANGEKPVWGEVEAWKGDTSKKDGVDFLNIMVHKVTKTDGTVQYYASTRDDKGVAGVDFDDGVLDLTLPYGRYMLREISVDSADAIYENLTNVNSGYLYDTISQNWRRQFSIGYETNTKHPALTYYNETGSFSTLVNNDSIANPTAIRVTPTDTIVYDPADNHPVGTTQTANAKHGTILDMTATNDAIPNLVSRFDMEFIKKDIDDKLLAGAMFLITSKTTGETHVAITDENGKFSTFPENQLSWHTKKNSIGVTNGNDEGILTQKSEADIPYLDMTTDDKGNVSIDTTKGITYTKNDAGKDIINSTNARTTNGIWFYGRIDKKTYDPATGTGNGSGGVTGNVNEDTTKYISVVKPDEIQMYRNDMGAFPYDDYIIQELPTANTVDYDMVRFEVHMSQATKSAPSDGLKNRTEMELKSPDPILLTTWPQYFNRNSIDAGTVTDENGPEIQTTLVNQDDVAIAKASKDYTLIDKVQWSNLKNGHTYRLVGQLWQKNEKNELVGDKPIATKEQTFNATGASGIENMTFENLDLTSLTTSSLVAFEYLYDDEISTTEPFAKHEDPADEGQSVTILDIKTTLVDSDGDKEVRGYKEIKLIDHIAYTGLIPNKTYTFTGTLHFQKLDENGNVIDGGVVTDASGNPVTASKDELIKTRDGIVDVEFVFTAPDVLGEQVVAFEDVKEGDVIYATHADINDKEQTVYVPDIQTTALDGITDDHIGLADDPVRLKDIVVYKNLVKGQRYELDGTLMNQETGEPLKNADGTNIVGTLTFVAGAEEGATIVPFKDIELASGTVEVPFDVPADVVRGMKAVVFEKLYPDDGGKEVEISKTDAVTTEELPGAKLIIKRGEEIVAAWTSTNTPHKVKLPEGTYTLTEITAPAGYEVAETIEFKVGPDGLVDGEKVEMKDAPIPPPNGKHEVEISKTDAVTTKELPGATLIVAKDGKTVASWVSTDTPHKIKLDEGTYTLTEITAPYGYDMAETITFKVDANGLVDGDKVEMKDKPIEGKEIEISKTDAVTTAEIPGATLIIQKDGQLVETWVSTDTPHKVKLAEGTYTLTEITAPYGYDMAETITFKVGADGLVDGDKVEMKDAPEEPIAIHEDINDEGQSVNYPDIKTEANVAGAKSGVTASGEVHLTDVVTYTNLIPGREYVMKGVLMDKVTNQPALTPDGQQITSEAMFTPETASGTMQMEFVFNARALQFHDVVVFENCYTAKSGVEGELIHVGKHENIDDAAQTVGFGEDDIADTPIQSTGDEMPVMPLLITIGIAFGAAGAFGIHRKHRK